MNNEAIENFVEVTFEHPDDFLKIKETLTRIGVGSVKTKKLYQSCHILHKRGKYYITHFKELFILDGKEDTFSEEDKRRRNTIIKLLAEFGLISIVDPSLIQNPEPDLAKVKILKYREKQDWELLSKYQVGK